MLKSILLTVVWAGIKNLYQSVYLKYLKYKAQLSDRMSQYHRQRADAMQNAARQEQRIEEAGQAVVDTAETEAAQQASSLSNYTPDYGDKEE